MALGDGSMSTFAITRCHFKLHHSAQQRTLIPVVAKASKIAEGHEEKFSLLAVCWTGTNGLRNSSK